MTTHEAVIVAGAMTAIGTAFRGSLTETDAMTLGTAAVAEAVRRSGIDPLLFDDVILGESRPRAGRAPGTAVPEGPSGGRDGGGRP